MVLGRFRGNVQLPCWFEEAIRWKRGTSAPDAKLDFHPQTLPERLQKVQTQKEDGGMRTRHSTSQQCPLHRHSAGSFPDDASENRRSSTCRNPGEEETRSVLTLLFLTTSVHHSRQLTRRMCPGRKAEAPESPAPSATGRRFQDASAAAYFRCTA